MNWLRHVVFAAAYTAMALAVALTLPLSVPEVDRHTALLFGLVLFLAGALLHEFWTRQDMQERLERRLWRLKEQQEDMRKALIRLEERLEERLAPLPVATRDEVSAVMAEARLIQALTERLPREPIPPPEPRPDPEPPLATPEPPPPDPQAQLELLDRPPPPPPPVAARPPIVPAADADRVLEQVRLALRSDRVDVFLQPVVSLPQRKHRFYEVFSRIRAEDGTTLLPEQYLGMAARAGLIGAIDNLLLFRAIQLIRETEKRNQNVGFFCNISAATLNDAGFMAEFLPFIAQHRNLAPKLVFELVQADLMQRGVPATGFLEGLRQLGFRFSMDQVRDFAMDWDALAGHEIRFVKLDAADLLATDGPFASPAQVQEVKRRLDRNAIDLIVEKIETDGQLLDLLDLAIDFGQGYLFGEPRLAKRQGG